MGRLTYSASGAVASFKAAGHVPVRHAKFNFTPTQDLHGQDSPWPAGGGVNKFDKDADISANAFFYKDDGTTATSQNYRTTDYIPIKPNTEYFWAINGVPAITGAGTHMQPRVAFFDSSKNWISSGDELGSSGNSSTSPANAAYVRLPVYMFRPETVATAMFVEGSSIPTSYSPYSNICPISGWTGLTGYKDSKHGGLIQWNQLINANTSAWATGTATCSYQYAVSLELDHKYYIHEEAKNADPEARFTFTSVGFWNSNLSKFIRRDTSTLRRNDGYSTILNVTANMLPSGTTKDDYVKFLFQYISSAGTSGTMQYRNFQVIDLTQAFGSTIADYVYSLETSTAGAGVAWFRAIFPLDYYAYNSGTQTTVDAVNGKTDTQYPITFPALGVNQWDEEWEVGGYNASTGAKTTANNLRNKNYIQIVQDSTYYMKTASEIFYVLCYDANKTYLGLAKNVNGYTSIVDQTFIPKTGTTYINFYSTSYGTTYNHDICINYPSTDTSYHPYTNVVYGGYVDLVTGEVISNYGIKILADNDIQSVTSSYENVVYAVTQIPSDGLRSLSKRGITSITGEAVSIWPFDDSGAIGKCAINAQQEKFWFGFKPGTTLEQAKSVLVGVQLAYELATPALVTTLTPTELQTFIGSNYFWSDANGDTAVEYDAHEATEVFLARKRLIEENSPVERTATGAVASFTTRSVLPLKECKCEFSPVQDLHGETAPYPAGGGVNIWDEEWETGQYNPSSGEPQTANNAIRSKNFIPIMPSTTYYCHMPSGVSQRLFWYDSETNWIGTDTNASFTTPANAQYMKFHTSTGYGGTYNHDISINYPSTDTSYHPYANICPITGWTGANVSRTGKNLCDGMAYIVQLNTGRPYILNQDTHPVSPYTNPNNYGGIGFVAPVKAGETYAMSTDVTGTSTTGEIYYGIYRSLSDATNRENLLQYGWHQREFTSNYDGIVVLMRYNTPSGGEVTWTYAQLELGSTTTAYEPYSGNVYHCSFGGLTKNLFDESTMYHGWYQPSMPSNMTEDEAYRTAIAELPAGTYTFSTNLPNVYMLRIAIGDENNGNIASTSPLKFTLSEPNTVKICFRKSDSSTITESFNTQIEAGSTATSYEPYGTIYGGYLTVNEDGTGSLVVNMAKRALDGTEPYADYWSISASNRVGVYIANSRTDVYDTHKCSDYKTQLYGGLSDGGICKAQGGNTAYIIKDSVHAFTIDGFKQYVSQRYSDGNPITLVYELATPIIYQLTPQQIRSLIGQNNVFSDVNGNITVKYWKL